MFEPLNISKLEQNNQHFCIYSTYPEMSNLFFNLLIKNYSDRQIVFFDDIHFIHPKAKKLVFIPSLPLKPRSIQQMIHDKSQLEKLFETKLFVQLLEQNKITFLFSLEHSYLVKNTFIFPEKIFSYMATNQLKPYIFPFDDACKKNEVTVIPQIIQESIFHNKQWHTYLTIMVPCLYRPGLFDKIYITNRLKKNVFFASVNSPEIGLQYEFIKIDALHKIKKESENYNLINGNRLANFIYHIKSSILFENEYLGAMRSSAETQESYQRFKVFPLKKILEERTDIPVNDFSEKLDKCLKALHDIKIDKNTGVNSFSLYQKHLFPSCATIKIHEWQLKKVSQNEITPLKSSMFSIKNFWELSQISAPFYCKILEVTPSQTIFNQCQLILIPITENQALDTQFQCHFKNDDWKEIFIHHDIHEGSIIKINSATLIGNLFFVYRLIKDNVQLVRFYDTFNPNKIHISSFKKEFNKFTQFVSQKNIHLINDKLYINPLYLFKKVAIKDTLYLENTGSAHGDLNLNNIVLHMLNQDDMKKNGLEDKNTYEPKLIDLSAFKTDFPLAFDYVKLEVEIKNHILSTSLIENLIRIKEHDFKKEFTDTVLSFEMLLTSSIETNKSPDIIHENKKFTEKMKQLFPFILKLRHLGINKYKRDQKEAQILYMQQLFFYSLRSMMYKTEPLVEREVYMNTLEIRNWRKRWAFLGALVASESFPKII